MVRVILLLTVCSFIGASMVGCKGGVEIDPDMTSSINLGR